jgi:hypothetical protein
MDKVNEPYTGREDKCLFQQLWVRIFFTLKRAINDAIGIHTLAFHKDEILKDKFLKFYPLEKFENLKRYIHIQQIKEKSLHPILKHFDYHDNRQTIVPFLNNILSIYTRSILIGINYLWWYFSSLFSKSCLCK